MNITATMVKTLREMTGAGMMDCKKALVEANGDMEEASDILRAKGMKTADKKAGRDTNEGLVGILVDGNNIIMTKVNCETDFVARTEGFQNFVTSVLEAGVALDATETIATLGENIKVADVANLTVAGGDGITTATYVHNPLVSNMGTIGVVVHLTGSPSDELAKQIAMHIAASKPKAISVEQLDQKWVEKERTFLINQARESGKPENIIEKMIDGRMKKTLREVTLLDQPFVVNPDQTVGQALDAVGATVLQFSRLEVGE